MTQPKVLPKSITLNKLESYLEIIWQDGKVCRYPLSNLREACPCVGCRGGHEFMREEYDPIDINAVTPKREYKIEGVEPVGNYAIQPIWDDGHSTGIYTWEYLRRLCPKQ